MVAHDRESSSSVGLAGTHWDSEAANIMLWWGRGEMTKITPRTSARHGPDET